ncbi:MAG: 3-oxo-tetronate kinase [Burkholderiaceae bacterium]
MTPLLGCIADDFTGATDLANNLVRAGMRTVQTIGVPESADAVFADAIVVALKSRTVPATDAVAQSLKAYQWLKAQGVSQIYFKYCSTFDSTPAGNIGPVTDALLDAIHGEGKGFTIVCPAFPENQRTIFNGHLFVGEQLLSDSGMRDHPLTPMTDANLVRVMQAQTKRRVGLVNYATVSKGADAIKAAFQNLQDQGYGVAVVDAISNTDLMAMGAALAGMPLVTAGSGVAIGLPQNWRATGQLAPSDHADQLPPPSGYQAVISGSCSVATNQQVAVWRDAGLPALAIDPLGLANGTTTADAAADWARQHLPKGPVLVYATAAPETVREIQAQLGVAAAGALVESALSRIAVSLIESGVRQLVVAGGETSGAVVQALAVARMAIGPQIDPGVPWTCVNAEAAGDQTVHVALKSGNFGTPDFFQKAFAALTPKSA